jgi:hypothetical protein
MWSDLFATVTWVVCTVNAVVMPPVRPSHRQLGQRLRQQRERQQRQPREDDNRTCSPDRSTSNAFSVPPAHPSHDHVVQRRRRERERQETVPRADEQFSVQDATRRLPSDVPTGSASHSSTVSATDLPPVSDTVRLLSLSGQRHTFAHRCHQRAMGSLRRARVTRHGMSQTGIDPHYIGAFGLQCPSCHALHWLAEKRSSSTIALPQYAECCYGGDVQLPFLDPLPAEMRELYDGSGWRSMEFQRNIRQYNTALSFTSTGGTGHVVTSSNDGHGPLLYKIQGEIHHQIGLIQPEDVRRPVYSQLYIYNHGQALQYRSRNNRRCSASIKALTLSHF